MSIFRKASIGVALVLVLVLGAWLTFAPPRQTATAPDASPSDKSGKQPAATSKQTATVTASPTESGSSRSEHAQGVAEAVPLDLTDYYGLRVSAFDGITQHPWPAVPRGSQSFAGVPLEIGGAIFLWGERNANKGLNYPEQITGIGVAREFETLYVCHAAFFEGPSRTPVYEVVFHYDDATTASDTIVCGEDVRDWYADRDKPPLGPSSPRSTLAWDGDGKAGDRTQAIRFCLTAIANPHPDKKVTALHLVSSKTQAAACILAITTGRADLMKRAEAEPPGEVRDE
jgi:hypothetical protein